MPELPEVETVCRGITPHILGQKIVDTIVRRPSLRWPIPEHLPEQLNNNRVDAIHRRGKYLLFDTHSGTLIVHLGMSGSIRIVHNTTPLKKHDHVDICFANKKILRFNDARRFGAILWTTKDSGQHPLLKEIGLEPLSDQFNDDWFYHLTIKKKQMIKSLLMNHKIVAGIGNIYATESLFLSGIRPNRCANTITHHECTRLICTIKTLLKEAIKCGGTTLKDFFNAEGKPGYFAQKLWVYGRGGHPCKKCHHMIEHMKINQRSSYFCPTCQH